jgi:hypothetical protein
VEPIIIQSLGRRAASNTILDTLELDIPGVRWESMGIEFNTSLCSDPCLVSAEICEDEPDMPKPVGFGRVVFKPWRSQFAVSCNPAQLTDRVEQEKFFAAISDTSNGFIHKALASGAWNGGSTWTGLAAPAATATTYGPTVLTAGPVHVRAALGQLLQAGSSTGEGSELTIHMSPFVANLAVADRLVYRNGNRLRTVVGDHLVVADGGFSGVGPGGVAATATSQWIYATGPFYHKVGTTQVVPGWGYRFDSRELQDYIDKHSNRLYVPVETFMIAAWDSCVWFSVNVALDCGLVCK